MYPLFVFHMIVVAIVISNTVFNRTGVAIIEPAVIYNTVFNRTVVAIIVAAEHRL